MTTGVCVMKRTRERERERERQIYEATGFITDADD